jgi:phage gp29-like protein
MVQILDHLGRPIQRPATEEMQSDEARVAGLLRQYSDHPSRGLTPAKLAGILQDAEHGHLTAQCELAEDMEEKDGHIYAESQKRRSVLLGLDYAIVPPRNPSRQEQADVDMLNEWLEDNTEIDELVMNASDAILKSFNCQELEWRQEEGLQLPRWHWRDPAWFQTHPNKPSELRLQSTGYAGDELQPFGWITHCHAAKSGYVGRNALIRVLAWPYLFKNFSVRDLAEFLEIYGLPLRLGKYPTGASEKEKATLMKAVMAIGHNAGGIIPRGMEIEFQEAAKGGSDPFESMIAWCERTQSKAILGGTLTSQADGKSSTNALGNVHNEVRKELRDSDAKQIANTITRDLIYPMYALNCRSYRGPHRIPRFEFDLSEPEDLAYYAQHLPPLVNLGMQIPQSFVSDRCQIPAPANGEPVLRAAGALPSEPASAPVSLAALKAGNGLQDQSAIDDALDSLEAGDLNKEMTEVLAPLFQAANESPETLGNRLAELWPEMSDEQLSDRLTRVLFVGELWGMING